jgi:hypothetical protein
VDALVDDSKPPSVCTCVCVWVWMYGQSRGKTVKQLLSEFQASLFFVNMCVRVLLWGGGKE